LKGAPLIDAPKGCTPSPKIKIKIVRACLRCENDDKVNVLTCPYGLGGIRMI